MTADRRCYRCDAQWTGSPVCPVCPLVPYYSEDGITIYLGDCRDVLPRVSADVLCLDSPYGTNEHGGYGRRQLGLETIENDGDLVVRDWILNLRVWNTAIVFGSPRRPEPHGEWDYRVVWDKRSPGLGSPWRWQHEMMYLRGEWSNKPSIPSVLSFSAGNAMRDRFHPHEKPVALLVTLLGGTSGSVIDPCMGSGSTLVAAKVLTRKAIGIETEERYCAIAVERLRQGALFSEATA